MKTKGKAKGSVALKERSLPATSPRQLAYQLLVAAGLPREIAKQKAGYAPTTCTTQISKTQSGQELRQRLELAAASVGVSAEANLASLGQIAYNQENQGMERIGAIKESNSMLGWRAPERMEIEQSTTNVSVLIGMMRDSGASIGEMIRKAKSVSHCVTDSKMASNTNELDAAPSGQQPEGTRKSRKYISQAEKKVNDRGGVSKIDDAPPLYPSPVPKFSPELALT
jgi:hypothetical protein